LQELKDLQLQLEELQSENRLDIDPATLQELTDLQHQLEELQSENGNGLHSIF
jgi:hypothetical protein